MGETGPCTGGTDKGDECLFCGEDQAVGNLVTERHNRVRIQRRTEDSGMVYKEEAEEFG